MPDSPRVTVLTTSHDGAATIHRVIESLESQSYRDFEWVVVDDGSRDGLHDLLAGYAEKADFPVLVHRLAENLGRPSAFNRGVELARGELLVTADDDDRFVPEALETFVDVWDRYGADDPDVAGVAALCRDQHGRLHGDRFPEDLWIADLFEERYRRRVKGEKWRMTTTAVRRAHPWRTDVDRYMRAGSIWLEIATRYKLVCINQELRIFYRSEGVGNLGAAAHRHPDALRHFELEKINRFLPWINGDRIFDRFTRRAYRNYIVQSLRARVGAARMLRDIEGLRHRAALLLYLPVGLFRYYRRRYSGRI